MSQKIRIVFRGEIAAGETEAVVKQRAAQLFNASPEQIERIFSGAPVLLRKDLSEEEGARYRERLEKAGMRVYVEGMRGRNIPPPSSSSAPASTPVPAPADSGGSQSKPASVRPLQADVPPSSVPTNRQSSRTGAAEVPDRREAPAIQRDLTLADEKDYSPEVDAQRAAKRPSPYRAPAAKVVSSNSETAGFLDCFGLSSSGCMSRMTYWTAHFFLGALLFFIIGIRAVTTASPGGTIPSEVLSPGSLSGDAILVALFMGISLIFFTIVTSVQRCRDIGWSPWCVLLFLIPGVGSIFRLCLLFCPSGGYDAPRSNVKMLLIGIGVFVLNIGWVGSQADKIESARAANAVQAEQKEKEEMQAAKERQQRREQKEAQLQKEMKQKKEEQLRQLQKQLRARNSQ